MGLSFNQQISVLGYRIHSRDEESILIAKEKDVANIYIFFDIHLRQMTGCIATNGLIYNLDQISRHYAVFREMRQDLKKFQQLCNYAIID